MRSYFYLCLLACFLSSFNSFSQKESNDTVRYETKKIYDPLTKNFLLYTRMDYAYLVPGKYDAMGVIKQWSLPVILKASQETHIKKINQRMKAILCEQPDTEAFIETITSHCKQTLATHVYVYSDLKDTIGVFRNKSVKAKFMNAKFSLTYSGKSILTLVAMFNYTITIPGVNFYGSPNYFNNTYYQTYYFDLATGKEYSQDDVFKSSSLPELEQLAGKLANERAKLDTTKVKEIHFYGLAEGDEEFTPEVRRLLNSRDKKLKDFSLLRDGIFFPQAASFTYTIPAMTPCTKNMFGMQITVRIPFEKLKAHLNPKGPFAYFIDSLPPLNKTLKNNFNPLPTLRYNLRIDALNSMDDPMRPLQMKKVKKMSIYAHYHTEDTKEKIEHNELLQENHFLKNGLLSKVIYYERGYNPGKYIYSFWYDDRKNLIRHTYLFPGEPLKVWKLQYDANNNLTIASYDSLQDPDIHTYYEGFFVKEFVSSGFEPAFQRFDVDSQGTYSDAYSKTDTEYDSLGRLTGEYRNAYTVEEYDMEGNVSSSYIQGDRSEGNFYTYDAAGNIIKAVVYGREHTFKYDTNNRLIEDSRSSYEFDFPYYSRKISYDSQGRPHRIFLQNYKKDNTLYAYTFKYVEW